jgi:ribosome-associated protein
MTPPSGPAREDLVKVNPELSIPMSELQFRFSRSSGPGGQHVNRTETRVELIFDVRSSPSLTDDQRRRLLQRLGRHLDTGGVLHVISSETRSQLENRIRATERFRILLAGALRRRRRRVPTAPSVAARERRITTKKERSTIKQSRRRPSISEDSG